MRMLSVSAASRRVTRRAALAVGVVAVTALTSSSAMPTLAATDASGTARADPSGTPLLTEEFKSAAAPDFTGYDDACLTGAPALPAVEFPPAGDHPLAGCRPRAAETAPEPPRDAAPRGYLQLTDNADHRAGAVLFNRALPANQGLNVTFDSWQVGGTAADGISFFLVNGAANLTSPGGFGGSLGYAQFQQLGTTDFHPGVALGYLGVGLDVWGNFFGDTEQRGMGCPAGQRSPAGSAHWEPGKNMVTLRGPGNEFDGYCFLTATANHLTSTSPWLSTLPGALHGNLSQLTPPVTAESAEAQLEPDRRRINVVVTPTPDPRVIVSIEFGNGPMEQVLDVPAPQPVPATYKFGFAASTGNATDVHLIRNVKVESDRPLPELNLVKQIPDPRPGRLRPGDTVTYQYVVTNSGNTDITDLVVADDKTGQASCPQHTLAPGETITCTATYVVRAEDVRDGVIVNTAVATGQADGSEVTSPPATEQVEVDLPPSLSLEKLVQTPGPYHAGQEVEYSYRVTNTGGATLTGVRISDDHVNDITCDNTTLTPAGTAGDQTTCHGTYLITEEDAINGLVTNTAVAAGSADGTEFTSPEADQTIYIGSARLTVRKREVTPGPHHPGSTVRYEYVVTNTGSHTLHEIIIDDDHVADIVCDQTTLAPGESTTCHGSYLVTTADGAAGQVTNHAQAAGTDDAGNVFLSDVVSRTIRISRPAPVRHHRVRRRIRHRISVTG